MHIFGGFEAGAMRFLQIDIVKCHGRDDCKTDEEIRSYFGLRQIYLIKNEIRFD